MYGLTNRSLSMSRALSMPRNLWVTWGGSYPGMLAGWSRLKHPELIHASVASSAPVFATFDMCPAHVKRVCLARPQYTDHMAYAYTISHEAVGGSKACKEAIRAGHAWVEDLWQPFKGLSKGVFRSSGALWLELLAGARLRCRTPPRKRWPSWRSRCNGPATTPSSSREP